MHTIIRNCLASPWMYRHFAITIWYHIRDEIQHSKRVWVNQIRFNRMQGYRFFYFLTFNSLSRQYIIYDKLSKMHIYFLKVILVHAIDLILAIINSPRKWLGEVRNRYLTWHESVTFFMIIILYQISYISRWRSIFNLFELMKLELIECKEFFI